jgi:hypothetical protein
MSEGTVIDNPVQLSMHVRKAIRIGCLRHHASFGEKNSEIKSS